MEISNLNDSMKRIEWGEGVSNDQYNDLYLSLFSNCQSVGVEYVSGLLDQGFTEKNTKKWLQALVRESNRRQLIIDVKDNELDDIKRLFKPFKQSFKTLRYQSTNGNYMVICVVQINPNKLK